MINGPCVGAGFDLASHCDLAVASTAARYQVAYVKRGVYADLGGFWSLPKILGWRKAMELMMTGRFMTAQEAHEAGFTNYLVEPGELESKTMELALEVEAGPPIAQKLGKVLAMRTAHLDFDTAMQWSESAIPVVGLSKDSIEGMRAFAEKRETDFQGR
ncbi:MAG: enoyl-CoA hydratase-related protein [Gammaproteobacteria bacterium]